MHAESEGLSWVDIEEDLACAGMAKARHAEFFARAAEAAGRRGERRATLRDPRGHCGMGRDLLTRCSEMNRHRFETLLHFEETFPCHHDHGFLIGPACQILESELDRIVATPSLGIAETLIDALQIAGHHGPAEALEKWAANQSPTTMGIECNLLLAFRRGCERGASPVLEFLECHFAQAYQELLKSKKMGRCLEAIRNHFRNPASHGKAIFGVDDYEQFARLVVANCRFVDWDSHGPDPAQPDAGAGILHHHLRHTRQFATTGPVEVGSPAYCEASDPLAELLAMQTPPLSPLKIQIQVEHAGTPSGSRNVNVTQPGSDRPFHLGDPIRFGFQANRACHVVLIDVGTSGTVAVLWPNAWHRDSWVEGGKAVFLPEIEKPEFDFTLSGRPGQERVIAITTLEPLSALFLPERGDPFRMLTPGEIERLVAALNGQSPGWAVATSQFPIDA